MDNATLFWKLLRAESEDAVEAILNNAGYLADESVWMPLGQIVNNWGAVGNQQSDASAALLEKIINGIDAVFMALCYERGIDPEGPLAPKTIAEAAEVFLAIPGGRLNDLPTQKHKELADNIHLVAVGGKQNPNYLIIDRGEGQTPAQFPKTFLSLLRSNKMSIPFVQGRFNSGGTGILPFCGERNFQLIASRRHPHCPVDPTDDTAELWGFTVVRRLLPAAGRRNSMYVYLAPSGSVPSFRADAIAVLPGRSTKNRPAEPYAVDLPWGTCIKLYDYRWKAKSLITTEGRYELERLLLGAALPFRVSETRPYSANYYSATVTGGWNRATAADEEADGAAKLEPGFPAPATMTLDGIGGLPYQIAVFKGGTNTRHVPHGIYFLLNGQVHGGLRSDFVTRRLKFDYLTDKYGPLLVAVDCTGMDQQVREDFIMASRDRVRRNETYDRIAEVLENDLKSHPGLQELNQQRRKRVMEAHQNAEGPLNVFQSLLDADPSLASLFGAGDHLVTSTGPAAHPPFTGREFPTFFRLSKEPKAGLEKPCPVNRTCRIEFETDAVNDYFQRASNPGRITIDPPNICEHSRPWNGRFETRFRVPWDAQPGDITKVTVTVTDIQREAIGAPFICTFALRAEAESDEVSAPGGQRGARGPDPAGGAQRVVLAFPNYREVGRSEWDERGFDKYTSLRIMHNPDGGYDFLINVDNTFLLTELSRAKEEDKSLVKYWFLHGLMLAALSMLKHRERIAAPVGAGEDDPDGLLSEDADDLKIVATSCDGMAQAIVPIIRTLSRLPGV